MLREVPLGIHWHFPRINGKVPCRTLGLLQTIWLHLSTMSFRLFYHLPLIAPICQDLNWVERERKRHRERERWTARSSWLKEQGAKMKVTVNPLIIYFDSISKRLNSLQNKRWFSCFVSPMKRRWRVRWISADLGVILLYRDSRYTAHNHVTITKIKTRKKSTPATSPNFLIVPFKIDISFDKTLWHGNHYLFLFLWFCLLQNII